MRLPAGDPATLPPPPTTDDECRWVYYSSGTTSVPKGAKHTDTSVIAGSNGEIYEFGFGTGDVYPIAWPVAHIGGIAMLTAVLRAGGALVLFEAFDPVTTPERMARHNPTILGSATPFFQAFMAAQKRHGSEPLFPALRLCVAGGAPTPKEVSREVAEVLGVGGVACSWGLTEFPVATSERPDDDRLASTVGPPGAGRAGARRRRGAAPEGPELLPRLPRFLFGCSRFRRGRLVSHGRPRVDRRAGPLAYRRPLEGRHHPQRGEHLGARGGGASADASSDCRSRRRRGAGPAHGERVCAVVVAEAGATLALPDILEYCVANGLARYKCPERLEIVETIPRNSMGKILKTELRASLT